MCHTFHTLRARAKGTECPTALPSIKPVSNKSENRKWNDKTRTVHNTHLFRDKTHSVDGGPTSEGVIGASRKAMKVLRDRAQAAYQTRTRGHRRTKRWGLSSLRSRVRGLPSRHKPDQTQAASTFRGCNEGTTTTAYSCGEGARWWAWTTRLEITYNVMRERSLVVERADLRMRGDHSWTKRQREGRSRK